MGLEQEGQQIKDKAVDTGRKIGDGIGNIGKSIWGKAKDIAESDQVNLSGNATKEALGNLKDAAVSKLDLSHNPLLTDRDLNVVTGLRNLTDLDLGFNTKITDQGLNALRGNANLKHLNLENTLITGATLAFLPQTALVSLVLKNDRNLSIGSLSHLANVRTLERVDLSQNSQITDAALPQLKKLTQVKNLDLRGTGLTDQAVAELKRALPNAQIRK